MQLSRIWSFVFQAQPDLHIYSPDVKVRTDLSWFSTVVCFSLTVVYLLETDLLLLTGTSISQQLLRWLHAGAAAVARGR